MMSQQEILILNKLINSVDFNQKIIGASILRELGKLGQRLYKICPAGENKKKLAENILKIKKIIDVL